MDKLSEHSKEKLEILKENTLSDSYFNTIINFISFMLISISMQDDLNNKNSRFAESLGWLSICIGFIAIIIAASQEEVLSPQILVILLFVILVITFIIIIVNFRANMRFREEFKEKNLDLMKIKDTLFKEMHKIEQEKRY